MTVLPLGPIHTLAADTLVRVGWTQGVDVDNLGQACLTGALKLCAPVPGDWLLARAVFRQREHGEEWNDAGERTAGQVVAYLRSAEITDADLALTFGPQWQAVVALVRRASVLTPQEGKDLHAAWDATREAAWDAAWYATRYAARDATRDAAQDAAQALVIRDLIGNGTFTQAHYDTLTSAWAHIIGPVHPDDNVEASA